VFTLSLCAIFWHDSYWLIDDVWFTTCCSLNRIIQTCMARSNVHLTFFTSYRATSHCLMPIKLQTDSLLPNSKNGILTNNSCFLGQLLDWVNLIMPLSCSYICTWLHCLSLLLRVLVVLGLNATLKFIHPSSSSSSRHGHTDVRPSIKGYILVHLS